MQEMLPKTYDELANSYIKLQSNHDILKQKMEFLEEQIRLMQRGRFGTKSESLNHPGMKPLFEEQAKAPESKPEETVVKEHKRKSARKPLPESLPREEVLCDLAEAEKVCSCCSEQMKKISEKYSEKLHMIPATYTVKKYIMPVYSCKKCETVKQAKLPYHPIPKCSVTTQTLAQLAVSKYIDGLPLHRQEKIFTRYHIDIQRDKMSRWMISLAEKLEPLRDLLRKELLSGNMMGMDETTIQVLKEKNRRPDQKSYMLVQAREGPPGKRITLFHYEKSRSAHTIGEYLKGFKGSLITDGLASYQSCIRQLIDINHGGCMAHARRKFTDAVKGKKKNSEIAKTGILIMKELFAIEKRLQGKSKEEILKTRKTESAPLMKKLEKLWTENVESIPRKSLTGAALNYLKNQWPLLVKFLDDPNLPMHNNYVERQIRPFALGRRAWLFADTTAGANANALFYSLLNTAKENGLNPVDYLSNLLSNLDKTEDYQSLLPFKQN